MGKQLWIPSKALSSEYSFINSYDQYKKLFQTRMAPENEIIRVQRDALEYLKINPEIQAEFDALNIDINEFGINSIIIKSHPTWLPKGHEEEAIKKILLLTIIWMILTAALFTMADYIEYRENLYKTYQNK